MTTTTAATTCTTTLKQDIIMTDHRNRSLSTFNYALSLFVLESFDRSNDPFHHLSAYLGLQFVGFKLDLNPGPFL